jgi:hypothetical protein
MRKAANVSACLITHRIHVMLAARHLVLRIYSVPSRVFRFSASAAVARPATLVDVGGVDGEDTGAGRADGPGPQQPSEHVAEGTRSLHQRLDELERLIVARAAMPGDRADEWLHRPGGVHLHVPAWKRATRGEARFQVAICTAAGIALQVAVPGRLDALRPVWILPSLQAALLIALVATNPYRINRESSALRLLSLTLAALLSFANAWSVVRLIIDLVQPTPGTPVMDAKHLLITGGAIWLTNVIVFSLWYWEFDRGGPAARAQGIRQYPDFQFVQMAAPDLAPPDWEPTFTDYLYLAFTNAAAFSPTDVMPLSRWAKLAMAIQAVISIVTVALIVARAVNILR